MNNEIIKSNIMIKLAAIFLCLVLISTYLTSGLYAKYTSRGTAGDSTRVATFKIETDLDYIELKTAQGEDIQFQLGGVDETKNISIPFFIENNSEVAVGYSVAVDFGTDLPEYLSLTLSDGIESQTISGGGEESRFEFADFGTMAAGAPTGQKENLSLTISVSDLTMITTEVFIPTAELTVRVYQID